MQCISPSHPLNYSYDGVIFFAGDAEGIAFVVVRAAVGEVGVVVASADGFVDGVHGDVGKVSELYEEGDDVQSHLLVYSPRVGVGHCHLEAGKEGVFVADVFKA